MKKILKLLKKRGNRGFTLLEVIISCALLGILVVGIVGFMAPVMSSVASSQKSARGLMVSESMEAYINRSIRNSAYVAIFTNATTADASTGGTITTDANLANMVSFVASSGGKYELNCIAVRYKEDEQVHQYKNMLALETVETSTKAVNFSKEYDVFEDCFYEGLFPKVDIEILQDPSGTDVPAIKTTVGIYSDAGLTSLSFNGLEYTDFINIRKGARLGKKPDGTNWLPALYPIVDLTAGGTAPDHPETYIYYVTRKIKLAPTTPPATP